MVGLDFPNGHSIGASPTWKVDDFSACTATLAPNLLLKSRTGSWTPRQELCSTDRLQ